MLAELKKKKNQKITIKIALSKTICIKQFSQQLLSCSALNIQCRVSYYIDTNCVPSIILIIYMTNKKKLGERDRHIKEIKKKKEKTNSVN